MKILSKLGIILCIGALLGTAGVSAYIFTFTRSTLQKTLEVKQSEHGFHALDKLDRMIHAYFLSIQSIGEEEDLEEFLSGAEHAQGSIERRLGELIFLTGPWDALTLADAGGTALISTDRKVIGTSLKDTPENLKAVESALAGKPYYSDFTFSETNNRPTMIFAAPVRAEYEEGRPIIGAAIGYIAWPVVGEILQSLGTVNKFDLFTSDGLHIATSHENAGELFDMNDEIARIDSHDETDHHWSVITPGSGAKEEALVTYSVSHGYLSYHGNHWYLSTETPTRIAFEPATIAVRDLSRILLPIALLSIGFILVLLIRFFMNPLGRLLKITRAIGRGDLAQRIPVSTNDELGELGRAFNAMTAQLQVINLELEKKVEARTEELYKKVVELEESKRSILDLVSDLGKEKTSVEDKVLDRTRELEQEKAKLERVTENIMAGIMLVDPAGAPLVVNRAARLILGIPKGKDDEALTRFFATFSRASAEAAFRACLAGKAGNIPSADAGEKIYSISFTCLATPGNEGAHYGHLIWIQDITELKLLERSKSEFVAIASHQLRTPLTVTQGNVEMLLDESFGKLNDEQRDLLAQTAAANTRLITLVNDMLDVTKIERGVLGLTMEKLNLDAMICSIIADLGDYAKRHNMEIVYREQKEGLPEVLGDKVRMRQVLQNLIDNAIRYSRPGKDDMSKIEVVLEVQPDKGLIETRVTDSGIGIPRDEQDKLFGRFYRASNAVKFSSGGTGLGLYIVKAIIEQHGGTIRFISKEGAGTTFYFTLPIARP